MIPFDETAIFPPPPIMYDLGNSSGPGMDTTIIAKDSGFVQTFAHYGPGRRRYESINFTVLSPTDLITLKSFFWCRSGSAMGFRFWDANDNSSASDGMSAPTMLDQPVVQDSNGNWRLCKQYAGGAINRYIFKPIVGNVYQGVGLPVITTAPVLADGGTLVPSSSYTLDTTTGIISGYTPSGAFTAGFYFHTPARFDSPMKLSADDYQIGSVAGLTIRELLYPVT